MEPDVTSQPALSRRAFLGSAAAGCAACAGLATAAARPGRIDVHFHLFPPEFVQKAPASANIVRSFPGVVDWSLEKTLEDLDRAGCAGAVISFPQPGMWSQALADQRTLARMCNDFFAGLASRRPDRFGLFAGLPPLTDIDGSLAEIAYGLDVLKAQGVRVMTSYRDRWLGDPAFEPIWAELDRRHAVVSVHPDVAACCMNIAQLPFGHVEPPLDTARAFASLWYSGALERYPNIRFILSHGGGALPMVADRVDQFGRPGVEKGAPTRKDAMVQFRRLYYDTANAASAPAFAALKAMALPDHILFGTDAPFVDAPRQAALLRAGGLDAREMHAVDRENAIRLMPDLKRMVA